MIVCECHCGLHPRETKVKCNLGSAGTQRGGLLVGLFGAEIQVNFKWCILTLRQPERAPGHLRLGAGSAAPVVTRGRPLNSIIKTRRVRRLTRTPGVGTRAGSPGVPRRPGPRRLSCTGAQRCWPARVGGAGKPPWSWRASRLDLPGQQALRSPLVVLVLSKGPTKLLNFPPALIVLGKLPSV